MKVLVLLLVAFSMDAYADSVKCSLHYRDTEPGTWFSTTEKREEIIEYDARAINMVLEDEISKVEIKFRPYFNSRYSNSEVKQANLHIFYKNKITLEPFSVYSKVVLGEHSYKVPLKRQSYEDKFLDRAWIYCRFS